MDFTQADLIKILLSILCGSIVGMEREYHNKTAGFRTLILICLGSTVFTIASLKMGGSDDRIAANIITGIGFIGAGVIFKDVYDVKGITTAAVIWVTAAIGMIIGIDLYLMGMFLSLLVIIILSLFSRLEVYLDVSNYSIKYSITFINTDFGNLQIVENLVKELHLKIQRRVLSKKDGRLVVGLEISGNKNNIRNFSEKLMGIDEIFQF